MTKNALINLVPDSIDNAAKNITDSPTKAIGETLTDIWSIVFGGIHQVSEKRKIKYAHELEQFKQELFNGINNIPPEKKVEPKIQIVASALENAKYCMEEKELRELFKNLIVASMNSDTDKKVHPSFADIIKQMSPLDALVINYFVNSIETNIPLVNLKRRYNSDTGFNYLYQNLSYFTHDSYNSNDFTLSIENLVRLNILSIPEDGHIVTPNAYNWIETSPEYLRINSTLDRSKYSIEIEQKALRTTSFGRTFISICSTSK